jgi:hypothetical protein
MPILAIIAIIAALGGGVSVAAQSALPGNPLYGIKVNVNEPVAGALTFSDQGKAAYEATLAERRLSEAEQLTVSSSVSADVLAQLQANFKAFADRTQQRIDALAATDPTAAADLASNFETALRAHDKVIARLAARDSGSTAELGKLQGEVDSELSDTVKTRTTAEADIQKQDHGPDVKVAAQNKLNAATNVISAVSTFIDSKKAQLGADAVTNATAKLTSATDMVTQGTAKIAAGDYAGAFILGNAAIRTAQEARALVDLQDQLNVDLHLNGTPSPSVHPTPDTQGYRQSQHDMGGGHVDIESGF